MKKEYGLKNVGADLYNDFNYINYDKAKATPEALRIINAMEVTLANYVSQLEEHNYSVSSTTINLEELMRSAA